MYSDGVTLFDRCETNDEAVMVGAGTDFGK